MNKLSIEEFKNRVVKSFSTRAAAYEAHAQVQSLAALLLSEFVAASRQKECGEGGAPLPEGTVLEIGSGTGFLSAHLLSHFPERPIVISDISKDMLDLCSARLSMCPGFNSERVQFQLMDGEDLQPGQYAAILSSFALQWFGDPVSGIANMARCLPQNGRIFFAVPGEDTFSQWRELCRERDVPFTGNRLPSAQDLQAWADHAGLKLQLLEYTVDHHYPDVRSMMKSLKASGTNTRREGEGMTVGQLRRLLRGGSPSQTTPTDGQPRGKHFETTGLADCQSDRHRPAQPRLIEDNSAMSAENGIAISYHILYGCMTK